MLLKISQGSEEELLDKYILSEKDKDQYWLNDPESELNGVPLHKLLALFSRQDHVDIPSKNKVTY